MITGNHTVILRFKAWGVNKVFELRKSDVTTVAGKAMYVQT